MGLANTRWFQQIAARAGGGTVVPELLICDGNSHAGILVKPLGITSKLPVDCITMDSLQGYIQQGSLAAFIPSDSSYSVDVEFGCEVLEADQNAMVSTIGVRGVGEVAVLDKVGCKSINDYFETGERIQLRYVLSAFQGGVPIILPLMVWKVEDELVVSWWVIGDTSKLGCKEVLSLFDDEVRPARTVKEILARVSTVVKAGNNAVYISDSKAFENFVKGTHAVCCTGKLARNYKYIYMARKKGVQIPMHLVLSQSEVDALVKKWTRP